MHTIAILNVARVIIVLHVLCTQVLYVLYKTIIVSCYAIHCCSGQLLTCFPSVLTVYSLCISASILMNLSCSHKVMELIVFFTLYVITMRFTTFYIILSAVSTRD